MRRKILSKALAAVLCAAMILPVMSGGFQAKAAEETVITDTFDNGMGNWAKISGAEEATVSGGALQLPVVQTENAAWNPTSVFSLQEWPDQTLKEVELEWSGSNMKGDASTYIQFIYYYTDAENFHYLSIRENNSGYLYMLSGTVKDGVVYNVKNECDILENDIFKNQQSNGFPKNKTDNSDVYYDLGFETGATITFTYNAEKIHVKIENDHAESVTSGYPGICEFDITSAAGDLDFSTTERFAVSSSISKGRTIAIDTATVTFEGGGIVIDPNEEAEAFRTTHATILDKTADTVTVADRAAVEAALTAYASLSSEAQLLLTTEKATLEALKAKIEQMAQDIEDYYQEDFETGNGAWVSLNDSPVDGWGAMENPDKSGINTSENVFNPAASSEFDAKYSLSDEMWEKVAGQKLASVTADVRIEGATWGHELKIYYYYKDENNYKAIQLMRETKGLPNVYNHRDPGAVYAFAKELVSTTEGVYTADRAQISYFTVPTDVKWLKLSLIYNEDNTITLTLRDDTTVYSSVIIEQNAVGKGYEEVVELDSQKFAFGRDTGASTDASRQNYIDNVCVNFEGSAPDKAERWIQANLDAITVDVEKIIPEQKAMVEAALAEYEELSEDAKAFASEEKAKLDALKVAGKAWNGDIAESFRTIYADALKPGAERTELEVAWNVLRRLPISVQEALADEKETLVSSLEALAGNGTKNPIDIACIGDSITFGQGTSDVTSWPGVLQTLLGDGYNVRNNGVSGFRVIRDYEAQDGKLQYELSGSAAWSEILLAQPDVVIVMLGTNDSVIENPNDDPEWKAEKQQMFKDGLVKMIRIFQSMPSSPTILFATSPTRYIRTGTSYEATDKGNWEKQKVVYELQLEVIEELGLPYVDIYDISEKWTDEEKAEYFNTNDALHFTAAGYEQFANEIFAYLKDNLQIGFQTDNGGLTYVYFEEGQTEPEPEPGEPTITGVTVEPEGPTVHVGKTQTFTATVTGTGDYVKSVTWSVSGNISSDTKIDNGILTVGEDETATTLTVTATSAGNTTIFGTANVAVEQHSFDGDWVTDETQHWKVCEEPECGVKSQVGDHTMGDWSSMNDDTHTRFCTVCGKTETAPHDYGEWTKADGQQHQRTCSASSCGHVQKEDHVGADEWKSDAEGHWHECEICGMLEANKVAHIPGPAATETTPQTCTECGYILEEALGHEHTADTEWQYDENRHWHGCAGCEDETVKFEEGDHTYGEWTVTRKATETEVGSRERTCAVCGYVQTEEIPVLEHTHQYGEEWKADGTGHWHVCACGEMDEVIAHTYGDWTVTKEATATENGSRERTCSVCGYVDTEAIPATGPAAPVEPEEPGTSDDTVTDGKTEPKTGENFPAAALLTLMLASAAVGTVLVVKRRRGAI